MGALYRQRSKESVHEAKEFGGERHRLGRWRGRLDWKGRQTDRWQRTQVQRRKRKRSGVEEGEEGSKAGERKDEQ